MGTNKKIIWSESELEQLKLLYRTTSNFDLSKILNKSKKNVIKTLYRLNLSRTTNEKNFITAKACKLNGRDLSFDFIKNEAKKYNTRQEFYLNDYSCYNRASKNKWLVDVCQHMVVKNFSIPQLLLKDILEKFLNETCNYNDRTILSNLEIDCFFPKWRIGWEYNGKYYHSTEKVIQRDKLKLDECIKNDILLLTINEISRDYEKDIKSQLIEQLSIIEKRTGIIIDKCCLVDYKPVLNYPNILTSNEEKLIDGMRMTEIKKSYNSLFKKIKKYKISDLNVIDDIKKYNYFNTFEEYKNYLIQCNYKSFANMDKKEHPHRVLKRWNLNISLIHNLFKK